LLSGVCNPTINCTGYKILDNNQSACIDKCPPEGYFSNSISRENVNYATDLAELAFRH